MDKHLKTIRVSMKNERGQVHKYAENDDDKRKGVFAPQSTDRAESLHTRANI